MEESVLLANARTNDFGSAGSRRVLRAGRIPAVIYGKSNAQPVHVTVDAKQFGLILRHLTDTTLLKVKVGDQEYECLVKDFQDDLLKDQIKHIDFYQVTRGQKLRTEITIELKGNPSGVRDGGVLDQVMHSVLIEALPKDLPEELVLDVSDMELNSVRHLSDIKLPQGVEILDDLDKTVASVRTVKEDVPETTTDTTAAATDAAAAPAAGAAAPAAGDAKAAAAPAAGDKAKK